MSGGVDDIETMRSLRNKKTPKTQTGSTGMAAKRTEQAMFGSILWTKALRKN